VGTAVTLTVVPPYDFKEPSGTKSVQNEPNWFNTEPRITGVIAGLTNAIQRTASSIDKGKEYLRCCLASGEGIVSLGVTQYVCVSAEPRLHAALISAAKVMRCIQCCLAYVLH